MTTFCVEAEFCLECFNLHQTNEGNFRFIFGIFHSTHRIGKQKFQRQNLSSSKMRASLFGLSLVEKKRGGEAGEQSKKSKSILMKTGDDLSNSYCCFSSGVGSFVIEDNSY